MHVLFQSIPVSLLKVVKINWQRFKTAVTTGNVENTLNCGAFKEALTFDSQTFLAKKQGMLFGKRIWKANGDQTL